MVPNDELNLGRTIGITGQNARDCAGKTAVQPITGISIFNANGIFTVDLIDQFSALHPGLKISLGHFHLKLSDCCLPGLLGIHARVSRLN